MKRKKQERRARRKNVLRVDASVGTGQRKIEKVFGLPHGSVRLMKPKGKSAKSNMSVGGLLDKWAK